VYKKVNKNVTCIIIDTSFPLYYCVYNKKHILVDKIQRVRNDVFSKKLTAGKKRTYFFDVRTTRNNDYFLTITESKRTAEDDQYERHKLFVYKEDLLKFAQALQETIDHIRTELLPDYDFEAYAQQEDLDVEDRY